MDCTLTGMNIDKLMGHLLISEWPASNYTDVFQDGQNIWCLQQTNTGKWVILSYHSISAS